MEKLTGLKKVKTAIFISGRGSNLKNLIQFSKTKRSPITINLIVANKKTEGLKYAHQYKINKAVIRYANIKITEKKILAILEKKKIEFICLAGFMKVLSKDFINKFKGKIINIHPSYLPKYKGLNTSARALRNNEKFSGCTVHYVSSKLDSGKIIMQKKINILKKETEISLDKKILKEEHKLYPSAILKIFN